MKFIRPLAVVLVTALLAVLCMGVPAEAQDTERPEPNAREHNDQDESTGEPESEPAVDRDGFLRIHGGTEVTNLVDVNFMTKAGFCGGTVVAAHGATEAEWVLTAAHCLKLGYENPGWETIHNTLIPWHDGLPGRAAFKREVLEIVVHPDRRPLGGDRDNISADIALLRIEPIDLVATGIKPIQLATADDVANGLLQLGTDATAIGWGGRAPEDESHLLRSAGMPLVDCEEWPYSDIVCAMAQNDTIEAGAVCEGDSGGPLFVTRADGTKVQIGIASFADHRRCDSPFGFSGWTDVSQYESWWRPILTNSVDSEFELGIAQNLWESRFEDDYTVSYELCETGTCVSETVTVIDDVITGSLDPAGRNLTVDQQFDLIQTALDDGSLLSNVSYGDKIHPGPRSFTITDPFGATTSFERTAFDFVFPTIKQAELTAFSEVQQSWAEQSFRPYTMTYMYCIAYGLSCSTRTVTVIDGAITESVSNGLGRPSESVTIDDMLAEIQSNIDDDGGIDYFYSRSWNHPHPMISSYQSRSEIQSELVSIAMESFMFLDPEPPADPYPIVTCRDGAGRIDVNTVNNSDTTQDFALTVGTLEPREYSVGPNEWKRLPVTDLANGDLRVTLTRNAEVVLDETVTVLCRESSGRVTGPDADVYTWCTGGRGMVWAQITNGYPMPVSYVVSVGELNARVEAVGNGAATRGVSGRPNGNHIVTIKNELSDRIEHAEVVNVDC